MACADCHARPIMHQLLPSLGILIRLPEARAHYDKQRGCICCTTALDKCPLLPDMLPLGPRLSCPSESSPPASSEAGTRL